MEAHPRVPWELPTEGPVITQVRFSKCPMSRGTAGMPDQAQADLAAFFQSHFTAEAVASFGSSFQDPAAFQYKHGQVESHEPAEEDDLGYYEDGVKRTLTDEQIEMFRQSDLRELRRKRERALKRPSMSGGVSDEDGGQSSRQGSGTPSSTGVSKKKKKKRKGVTRPRHEPKPDLRKRTWDIVEPGLDSLEYD